MSDRDVILDSLARAGARIRNNLRLGRLLAGVTIFIYAAVTVVLLDRILQPASTIMRSFWVVWFFGLGAFIITTIRGASSLSEAAADVDRRAGLQDEVVSAYWFVSQNASTPWIDLQIRRAAATMRKLDIRGLYPRLLPRSSYLAAAGLVLLAALNWVPFAPGGDAESFTGAEPDPAAAEAASLFNEIEEILAEAQELRPSPVVEQFQDLLDAMRDSQIPLDQAEREMDDIENRIDEANLDIASMLEGLGEMGEDLSRSEDTEAAGREMIEGDAAGAAELLEALADEFAAGGEPAPDLESALAEASANRQPGLDDLATQMSAAAEGLGNQDINAVEEALRNSAESLKRLANTIESQRLQNEAAARMDALQDSLKQLTEPPPEPGMDDFTADGAQEAAQMTAGADGIPMPSEEQQSGSEQMTGMEMSQGGTGEPGEMSEGGQQSDGQNMQNVSGDDGGMIPVGYGYSPAIKEGAATSLEVQLEGQAVEVLMEELAGDRGDEELQDLATRREESTLEFTAVRTELTPAQQELLNQDTIPREYQNLIRNYFEVIRPRGRSEDTNTQP